MIRYAPLYLIILFALLPLSLKSQEQRPQAPQLDTTILLREVAVEAYNVTGRLQNVPGSLSVLTSESLGISDRSSLATVVNTIPGVSMQTGTFTTSRIVIRGMGSRTPYGTNRIRAYLNEIPLTSADGVSTPEEIDLASLNRIEIIKGPASALYGSGLGGSMNLYTPVKITDEGNFSVQYGTFNTARSTLSGTVNRGNLGLWGSLSHLRSDGYRENSEYRRSSIISTARWKKGKWSVNALLLLIGVDGGLPSSIGKTLYETDPSAAAPNWKAVNGYKKYFKAVSGISFTGTVTGRLNNVLTVFGRINDNFERRPFNDLDDKSVSAGVRNKLTHHTFRTDAIIGLEWITEQYSWQLESGKDLLNENRENRKQLNAFSMFYYRPDPRLTISIAGAVNNITYRLTDLYPLNGDQSGKRHFPVIFSPRAGLNFAPSGNAAFFVSAGHGFSLPSPEETLLPEGSVNPYIKPEQGLQYETGARLSFADKRVEADVALYWIELNNLLLTKRVTEDIFTGINAGKTRHKGIELQLRSILLNTASFPGKLRTILGYTGSLNRFIDFSDDGNVYDGNILPGIPANLVQLQVKWEPVQNAGADLHLMYTGRQYLTDNNSLDYPDYLLVNIRADYEFKINDNTRLGVYAGINNVTDKHYASMLLVNAIGFGNTEPRYYYPGLPRNFYGGLSLHF